MHRSSPSSWLRRAVLSLTGMLTTGCPADPTPVDDSPAARIRTVAGPVRLPEGGAWSTASVESTLTRTRRQRSGRNLPGEQILWPLTHDLVLGEGDGARRVRLGEITLDDSTPEEERQASAAAPWTLSVAPDGAGLAVGAADADALSYIALGPIPVSCPALRVARGPDGSPQLSGLPGARDLALAHLDPTRLAALHPGSPGSDTLWQSFSLALTLPDDLELQQALVGSLRGGQPRLGFTEGREEVRAYQDLVARRPDLAAALRPALAPEQAWTTAADNAVVALERTEDPALESLLADLVTVPFPSSSPPGTQQEGNFHRHAVTALSRLVTRQGTARPATARVLVQLARGDDGYDTVMVLPALLAIADADALAAVQAVAASSTVDAQVTWPADFDAFLAATTGGPYDTARAASLAQAGLDAHGG